MVTTFRRGTTWLCVALLILPLLTSCTVTDTRLPTEPQEPLVVKGEVTNPPPVSLPAPTAPAPAPAQVVSPPTATAPTPTQVVPPLTAPAPAPQETQPPAAPQFASNVTEAVVVKVIDGDTIDVTIGGIVARVRYTGVDTPETYEAHSAEATLRNRELVEGKTVRLEKNVSEYDNTGRRLLRYAFVGDVMVNAELVRDGLAEVHTYPPDSKYESLLLSLQAEAKAAKRGIWQPKYVGSKNSDKYHRPTCSSAKQILPENQVWFALAADALAANRVPCGVCKPPTTD